MSWECINIETGMNKCLNTIGQVCKTPVKSGKSYVLASCTFPLFFVSYINDHELKDGFPILYTKYMGSIYNSAAKMIRTTT